MKEGVIIRRMIKADIEHISKAFIHQGWPGREDILTSYFQSRRIERGTYQQLSRMDLWQAISLYCLLPSTAFRGVYPELSDFNVLNIQNTRDWESTLRGGGKKKSGYYQRLLLQGLVYTRVMVQLKDCMSNGAISQMDLEFGLGITLGPLQFL